MLQIRRFDDLFENMFDDFFSVMNKTYKNGVNHSVSQRFLKSEKGDKLLCEIDVPGVSRDNIDVNLCHNLIKVIGTRRDTKFYNEFYVDDQLYDLNSIDAQLDNGVLTISFDKKKGVENMKKIEVKLVDNTKQLK